MKRVREKKFKYPGKVRILHKWRDEHKVQLCVLILNGVPFLGYEGDLK